MLVFRKVLRTYEMDDPYENLYNVSKFENFLRNLF